MTESAEAVIRFRLLPALLTCLVLGVLLPALASGLPQWSTAPVIMVLLLLILLLAITDWRQRLHARRFFVRHHVRPNSTWFALLSGGPLMLPWSLLKAAVLATAMLVGLMAGTLAVLLMVLSPLLVYWLRDRVWCALQDAIVADYLVLLSERLARLLALLLMLIIYLLLSFFLPQPDYAGTRYLDMASLALQQATAGSDLVTALRAIVALQEVSFAWPLQNLLQDVESRLLLMLGWSAILLKGTLAFLPLINLSLMLQRLRGAE